MITEQLVNPRSIVVIGGSNDIQKPGGKVLKNLIDGKFRGDLYVTNLKESKVQGIRSYRDPSELPEVDLAIIAIAARLIPETVDILARQKNTKAFIILSAGFSEESPEGNILEEKIVETINSVDGSLIGPNCIGVLTPEYHGVFTKPIPKLDLYGCDFISGSGATACFIMETGIPKGLPFARVFSVGNSAHMGVEDILKYMDETFIPGKSPKVKLLYIENIDRPDLLLKHASSLIRKGCKIAAIKAGTSEAGSRAASSHTGALASSDVVVDALFNKAGIIRCYGREELIAVASIFMNKPLGGNNLAIISNAGGPAVMLTDILSNGGLNIPTLKGIKANELLDKLFPGSSVANPIDFLATGTAEQLGIIIDYIDNYFDEIDGMAVIFGTPGLSEISDVYEVLDQKIKTAKKPIFPILPSILTAKDEIDTFISKGYVIFSDEVEFGKALVKVHQSPQPAPEKTQLPEIDLDKIRKVINEADEGYLSPKETHSLLEASGIPIIREEMAVSPDEAVLKAEKLGFPVVMKVIGPIHKSDIDGVKLNVKDIKTVRTNFDKLIKIPDATAVLIQPMFTGIELFTGVKFEPKFGHLIMCGLGGIFIEIVKDVRAGLSPISINEALKMIRELNGYKIIKGLRGHAGINEQKFAEIITRVSALVKAAPEIVEMDINPLIGKGNKIVAVDTRINIDKNK